MFLCILNFSVAHAVPCTVTVWIRVLVRQEEGRLCQVHFSLQLFFSKFQLLCIQWGSRRIALGALVNQNRFQGSCWGGVFFGGNRRPLEFAVFLLQPICNCCLDYLFCFWHCNGWAVWLTHVLTNSACHSSACFSVVFWSFWPHLHPFLAKHWWLVHIGQLWPARQWVDRNIHTQLSS